MSVKIVSEQPLTINQTTDVLYKHFTTERRNELAALLRAKVKKKSIAKQLNKSRTTIWRERKRGTGSNGRYYVRKSKRLAKEKRVAANARFRKIENNKVLRRYIIKKLKKYWSPEQIAGRWNKYHEHIGKDRKPAILTHVERKSGLILADKLDRATAEMTKQKTIRRFERIPRDKKHTITYDNGSSFSEHDMTEKQTGMTIYFAFPYHSWERGSNENANGLLRQFFPKKSLFATITQKDVQRAIGLLNNRPRKRLNYLTPYEIFNQKEKCFTLE